MIAGNEQRAHARLSADVPVEIQLQDIVAHRTEYLNDISFGGLSFRSALPLEPGAKVSVRIPLTRPVFAAHATVIWCRQAENADTYLIGLEFVGGRTDFRARMIEQVCHIENFKRELAAKTGQPVTGEQAAIEWIRRFADKFPDK